MVFEVRGVVIDVEQWAEIRRLLAATPDMPATVVAERIGWTRGMTVLRDRVREIRPDYLIPFGYIRADGVPTGRARAVESVGAGVRHPGRVRPDRPGCR